ncbi:hypothetical protein BC832DRAFT_560085 [Gaertneriomyces semiglobifer]|nr:hypothetical protein BC832DRAFT_560085 [Gaertneriomyces semiglobifer]
MPPRLGGPCRRLRIALSAPSGTPTWCWHARLPIRGPFHARAYHHSRRQQLPQTSTFSTSTVTGAVAAAATSIHQRHHCLDDSPAKLVATFSSLFDLAPVFTADPAAIDIINEPASFYRTLENGILNARRRIVLASLYLGADEQRVVDLLRIALKQTPTLTVDILLDYFRGTRGSKDSVNLLLPLATEFPGRVRVALYHSPNVGTVLRQVVPPRFIEGFGLQHMKIYLFDDDVMLSGANLNTDYFTDRQDRYVKFGNAPELSDYYSELVATVSRFSYHVRPTGPNRLTSEYQDNGRINTLILKRDASSALQAFVRKWHAATEEVRANARRAPQADTYVLPVMQMGQLGVNNEAAMIAEIMKIAGEGWKVHLSSGYLNFPKLILNQILSSRARYSILAAAPEANGFYGSKGVSRHLPAAYTYLERKLLKRAERAGKVNLVVNEYKRSGWTFHAKGLWCTPPDDTTPALTVIGSSNFGYRSFYRDVEAQSVLITSNADLRSRLANNLDELFSHSNAVEAADLVRAERKQSPIIAAATTLLQGML